MAVPDCLALIHSFMSEEKVKKVERQRDASLVFLIWFTGRGSLMVGSRMPPSSICYFTCAVLRGVSFLSFFFFFLLCGGGMWKALSPAHIQALPLR